MEFKTVPRESRCNMRALNVYTHYNLRILNFWKASDAIANVHRPETPAGRATRRKFAPAAQLHRQPRQGPRHHARAVDCTVSIAAAGRIVAGRSGGGAGTAADLAGAPARSAGRARVARAPARPQGSPGQQVISDTVRPPTGRRSRQF